MCSYVVKTDLNREHVMGGKKLIYQCWICSIIFKVFR